MRNESGKITLGFVIFIALCAIGLDAAFQIVPIYMNYLNFKSEINSRAMEPQQSDGGDKIRNVLINKAEEFNIPLDPEKLKIEFGDHSTHITVSWTAEAKFLGGHFSRKLPFTVDADKPNFRS
jgi:hypothetical protein